MSSDTSAALKQQTGEEGVILQQMGSTEHIQCTVCKHQGSPNLLAGMQQACHCCVVVGKGASTVCMTSATCADERNEAAETRGSEALEVSIKYVS